MLLGREKELARLRALLEEVTDGRSFAVVVHGEAGIGKTALLDAATAEAASHRILRVRGFEGAGEVPWAGLGLLVAPLDELIDRLPGPQASALRAVTSAEEAPGAQERLMVAVALLGLLSAAADAAPLLVLVDDVQWLDRATRDALLFVARRLGNEGVGLLLAARSDEGWDPRASAMETIELGGLGVEDARALTAGSLAPEVADELREATGGNPLALTELPDALTDEQRSGRSPLPRPLPAGDRVEELFARQIADLPEGARRAVGIASAMQTSRGDLLARAMTASRLRSGDLLEAEEAGVVSLESGMLTFRHPLVRAAAYHGMDD